MGKLICARAAESASLALLFFFGSHGPFDATPCCDIGLGRFSLLVRTFVRSRALGDVDTTSAPQLHCSSRSTRSCRSLNHDVSPSHDCRVLVQCLARHDSLWLPHRALLAIREIIA